MTDQERANAYLVGWLGWLPVEERDDFAKALAEEFGAVQLAERRAIAAWLRKHGVSQGRVWPTRVKRTLEDVGLVRTVLSTAADAIEKGEHGA